MPRTHQFFGVKAAQQRLARHEGGVIWHPQGSGKSILMVLIAKWLLEHDPDARILVITDRDELDKQIVGVMRNAGVIGADSPSPRISSRADFVQKLGASMPRLLCALIHKFDAADLTGPPTPVQGRFYVFVDECHRTQGGDMNQQMKRWLAGAVFVGFTGTPLLRRDKPMTRDVFGSDIHTYKFHQAVADKVVLDLKYEARDVPQRRLSQTAIDAWFEQKTKHLNRYQKSVLRGRWATLEKLMSAGERKQRIIANIIEDFSLKPRQNNDRGTATLVAASIYDACHYYRPLQVTDFGPCCGVITSYEPNHSAISREPPNSNERYKFDTYTQHVLKAGQTTKAYEDEAKRRFIEEPAKLKLLIVVSKLLTGFVAPSCTYIYLDNELRDHHLFQAICRTNRLDGDDKDYGHIVDFKELFGDVQQAIAVYNSDELDLDEGGADGAGGGGNNVELKHWLVEGRAQLDGTRQALHYLCELVPLPREVAQFLRHFCGNAAQGKLSNKAIAEGIINNVRKTIIRDQLTEPKFYERMSTLLGDLIERSRAGTEAYKALLRHAEALVKQLASRQPDAALPAALRGMPEAAVIYNNLDSIAATGFRYPTADDDKAALALRLDWVVRAHAPAGWKGDETRERTVQNALYPLLDRDRQATQALFDIIKNQPGC